MGLSDHRSGRATVSTRRTPWLALTGLQLRSGDAGPMMYVPTARSERVVTHRLGYARLPGSIETAGLHAVNEAFHHAPVIAEVTDGPVDGPTGWTAFSADLPTTSIRRSDGDETIVRMWNPSGGERPLERPLPLRSMRGDDLGDADVLRPRQIVSTPIEVSGVALDGPASVEVLTPIVDRVGPNRSRPDRAVLLELDGRIDQLAGELATVIAGLDDADGNERWIQTHRQYVVERELLELRLSRELNQRLLDSEGEVSIPDEADPTIAELGVELNDLRVKRRIYDYVVQALADS